MGHENNHLDRENRGSWLRARRIDDQLFIPAQLPLDERGVVVGVGDILTQTRTVFENLIAALRKEGRDISDVVRLNTYYVYDGPEHLATRFWEDMTQARLEYLVDPGPAATAVRVSGLPLADCLIQVDAIATFSGARRQRIMPEDSWDWSIPVPLSQGWRVGSRIYVGGQVSADRKGRAVAVGKPMQQTRNVLRFIDRVMEDASSSSEDISHLKICYKHDSNDAAAALLLDEIMSQVSKWLPKSGVAMNAFGVNLLYEGLVLEIDAEASVGKGVTSADSTPVVGANGSVRAIVCPDGEIHLSAHTAYTDDHQRVPDAHILQQLELAVGALRLTLELTNSSLDKLVKLNIYYKTERDQYQIDDTFYSILGRLRGLLPSEWPALTLVRVSGLPIANALIQLDGVADAGK